MELLRHSLVGLPAFLAYMGTSVAFLILFALLYTRITTHKEIALIKSDVHAATIAFSGSLLGFCLPVASAISHSVSLVDCAVWATIALLVQILAYYLVKISIPDISQRIEKGEISSGIWLGGFSTTSGILSAAAMTY